MLLILSFHQTVITKPTPKSRFKQVIKKPYYLLISLIIMQIKDKLLEELQKQIKEPISLEIPPNPSLGDFALPTFKLSKKPIELQKQLKLPKFIEKIEIKGPYLNFFINKAYLTELTINQILKQKQKYGSNSTGKGHKALVEHTSINPNASPHVGRARNAIIGNSIVKLLKFEGYKVKTHYYINDIGKQIAMLVLACKNKKPNFKQLLSLYINFNKKLENNPELESQVFSLLNKLEKGDKETIRSFKRVVDICIKGQKQIFKEIDITYDYFDYESNFLSKTNKILENLQKTGKLFTDKENRQTINLENFNLPMENPYLPLTRGDNTSMYLLRDIAYTIYKSKRAKDRNIVILGEDQKLYFQQLKAVLSLLNQKSPEAIHYSFILLPSGKMSTRKGEVVLLEDFMQEIRQKAEKEILKRHGKIKNLQRLSRIIAYGALKFTILKVSPDKNILFDINKALSFEGESSPYIQYAYVRANSILKKAKKISKSDYSLITTIQEQTLVTKLSLFPNIVKSAIVNLQPHIISNYSLELAKAFNEFYHSCQVLAEKEPLRSTRLKLVKASKQTLCNSLNLLGIDTPTLM